MNDVLAQKLTKDAWDKFCHEYLIFVISQQRQQEVSTTAPASPSPGRITSPSVPQAQVPVSGLQVSLKDYPLTTGKASDWPWYQRKLIATATANGHETILATEYMIPSCRNDPEAYAWYVQMNKLSFSALDYGTADSIIWHKVNKYCDTKDGQVAFIEVDTYQKG